MGGSADERHPLPWWNRFHVRLTLMAGALVFVVLTATAVVTYELSYESELAGLRGRLRATAATIARHVDARELAALPAEGAPDHPVVRDLFDRFRAITEGDPDVTTIYLLRTSAGPPGMRFVVDYAVDGEYAAPGQPYDASELPVLRRGFERISVEEHLWRDAFGNTLSGYAPVKLDGEPFALVGVDVDASSIEAMSDRVLLTTLAFYGVALLLLAGLSWIVSRRIRRPLTAINRAAKRIAEGDFGSRIGLDRRDEFGLVAGHFDAISESLEERELIREIFGRYVARDVARRILAGGPGQALGGEERDATIVFSDLEGYSTMNEQVPPPRMLEVLNEYLGAMNAIIDGHEGVVIEFLGDAILFVFNAPNDVPMHADTAVRCALAMRRRLDALNAAWEGTEVAEIWRRSGIERLRARIGIHTGPVVAGNIGSRTRMKYGVLGDVVNVAARLERMNKRLDTSILVSRAVYDRLEPDLRTRATSHGRQVVTGRHRQVEVWSL